jgi:amidase
MELLYASAFEIAKAIKAQTITAQDTLEFFIGRINQHNPSINSVVAFDYERARARAKEADVAASNGEDWGALHGVPCTIKDALRVKGLTTTGGDPAHKNHVPETNALAVQAYLDAGAIVFGKTNVPFMSSDLQSYNDIYGTTNNPWNTERTCGGSSGGAAASVAAGLTPIEIGSDIGGSIRTPCHFNGVYGHKPSWGIVPERGHLPPGEFTQTEGDLSVVGPIGTGPGDLEQALDLLAQPLPEMAPAYSINLPPARTTDPKQLRVAVWSDDELCPVDTEIKAAIEAAAGCLEKLGATVNHQARPNFDIKKYQNNYRFLLGSSMGGSMPASVFEAMTAVMNSLGEDDTSEMAITARAIAGPHRDWAKENERRNQFRKTWAEFFEDYDVLLCPSAFVTAFPHDQSPDQNARILTCNGEERPYFDVLFYAGLTLNAYLPATAVPVGTSSEGLPIGMQIAGNFLDDKTTLAVAKILEANFRGFEAPDL